jgi:hypothetical protein
MEKCETTDDDVGTACLALRAEEAPLNLQAIEAPGLLWDSLENLFQNESTSARTRDAEPRGLDAALYFREKLATLPQEAAANSKRTIELTANLDQQQARNVDRRRDRIVSWATSAGICSPILIERRSKIN